MANKIALITGGSRGIGRNAAENLARRGADIIFTYNANRDAADQVVAGIAATGRRAAALQLDTGNASTFCDFAARVREALARFGADRFDFLVNNAGTSSNKGLMDITADELDALYSVHFKGVLLLTQTLLPLMNDGGRIVNISSGLARHASPNRIAYGSLKGAVEVMTRYMALELGHRRIAVNCVAPGAVATDFSGGMVRDNPGVNQMVASHTALGRAGVPDDIGPVIASLLSEDNRWVNAQCIEVSGGMRL
ncbi:MAG: SDR family oxidoreductase [Proteobacteria bacterium]|nr:SDR family oxidoreductase [Pseudomonadota bacterium]